MDHETKEALTILLKAPTKEIIIKLCNEAFLHRDYSAFPIGILDSTKSALEITDAEAQQVLQALIKLVRAAVFQGSTDHECILTLFPDGIHEHLRDLLAKVFIARLPEWKEHTLNNLVSMPRLVDFDWRVDVKSSSNRLARMAVPTCLLHLQVQEGLTVVNEDPHTSTINVELSKETIDTMLDGLGKIRDQLNSVVNR